MIHMPLVCADSAQSIIQWDMDIMIRFLWIHSGTMVGHIGIHILGPDGVLDGTAGPDGMWVSTMAGVHIGGRAGDIETCGDMVDFTTHISMADGDTPMVVHIGTAINMDMRMDGMDRIGLAEILTHAEYITVEETWPPERGL